MDSTGKKRRAYSRGRTRSRGRASPAEGSPPRKRRELSRGAIALGSFEQDHRPRDSVLERISYRNDRRNAYDDRRGETSREPRRHSSRHPHGPLLTAFGDSFVGPLKLLDERLVVSNKIKGGSAVGISRAQSSTNSQELVLRELDTHLPRQILLCFGTVDLQTNYFYKLRDGLIPPLVFAKEVAKSYIGFIEEHLLPRTMHSRHGRRERSPQCHLRRIYVMNAFLPTIPDQAFARGFFKYSNAELEVDTSREQEIGEKVASSKLSEAGLDDDRPRPPKRPRDDSRPKTAFSGDGRLDLTRFYTMEIRMSMAREFNDRLREFCARHPDVLHFCDVNRHMVDPDTGLVAAPYKDTVDPTNIHIIWETSIFHWIDELAGSGLTHADISKGLDQSLSTYKQEKGERIKKRKLERNI